MNLFKGKIDAVSARKNSSENSDENDPKSHYEAKYTFPDKDEGYKSIKNSLKSSIQHMVNHHYLKMVP